MQNIEHHDFLAGAVLLIDKPLEWTSFDVVNKVRYALKRRLQVKKIKVGHAGTLDPLATGLLILCTGKATKQIDSYQAQTKKYEGTLRLGATTPSFDLETEIDRHYPTEHLTAEALEEVRQQFVGTIDQYPPMYSAIKVDGQPLYKAARKGKTVEVKSRSVTIEQFELTDLRLPEVDFAITCSKGTYIRSLAYDFGKAAGSGAHLTRLVRTGIGAFSLAEAWNLEELIAALDRPVEPTLTASDPN